MTRARVTFLILLAAVCLGLIVPSPKAHAARYAGEFLQIGIGARALGMGGAFVAIANDHSAFYWNPAGTGNIQTIQFSGMYLPLFDGLAALHNVGFALPITGAVVAVNWIRLAVNDIPEYPDIYFDIAHRLNLSGRQAFVQSPDGRPIDFFSDREDAYILTFAKMSKFNLDLGWALFSIPIEIPIGLNFKIIRHVLYQSEATGIGADIGMQVKIPLGTMFDRPWMGDFAWGFNYQDFTRTGIDWGGGNSDAIPSNFKTGVAYVQPLRFAASTITVAYDVDQQYQRVNRFGLEYGYQDWIGLRTGWVDDQWTAGAGLKFPLPMMAWSLEVDYAYQSHDLGNFHRISATLSAR
jgi:hypothetical protein